MLKYITRRPLWFNILVAIALVVILFLIFMSSLNWITKHGASKTVPAVTGKNIQEAEKQLSAAGFETIVQDSVYYDSLPAGVVAKQVPEPGQVVEVNRPVYVIITPFTAPDVSMPNLIGYSFRNAEMTLQNLDLKLGDTTYKPDFAKNSVTAQLFNGDPIKAGDKIKVGSRIDLVLGSGIGNEDMVVPTLIGRTLAEARVLLEANGLVLGPVVPQGDISNQESAYVVGQSPMPSTAAGVTIRIRQGQMIDVTISATPPPPPDSTQSNPPPTPQNP